MCPSMPYIVVFLTRSEAASADESGSFEVVPVEMMPTRVAQFRTKIQTILEANSDIWRRQQEKVKEDEEKARKRQEIDEQMGQSTTKSVKE